MDKGWWPIAHGIVESDTTEHTLSDTNASHNRKNTATEVYFSALVVKICNYIGLFQIIGWVFPSFFLIDNWSWNEWIIVKVVSFFFLSWISWEFYDIWGVKSTHCVLYDVPQHWSLLLFEFECFTLFSSVASLKRSNTIKTQIKLHKISQHLSKMRTQSFRKSCIKIHFCVWVCLFFLHKKSVREGTHGDFLFLMCLRQWHSS